MRTGGMMGVALLMVTGQMVAAPARADVKSGVDAWARGDYKRAVDEWRAPAVAGNADAQFNLGQAYKLGRGVPLDPALARSWFLKAASQGHLQAADNYGLALFENGQKGEAAPWLEKSVSRFEPRAQLVLGTMLFNGDGVPRDYPRAYALMTRASQHGLRSASDTLAQMDQYVSPADRQQGTALAQRYAAEENAMKLAQGGRAGGMADARPPATMRPQPVGRELASPMETRPSGGACMMENGRCLPSAGPFPAPPVVGPVVRPVVRPLQRHAAPPVAAPPVRVAAGGWRIQLGAFRDAGNAHALWSSVAGRLPGARPSFVNAAGVTRVQAGPFAGKADAQRACTASRVTCNVVAP